MAYIDWKVGDFVACVKEIGSRPDSETLPVVGKVYTIRALATYESSVGIYLVEIINGLRPYHDGEHEVCFNVRCFKKLSPNRLEQFKKVVVGVPA